MKCSVEKRLKQRGEFFRQFPVEDWNTIIQFETIIRNYILMTKLLNETK